MVSKARVLEFNRLRFELFKRAIKSLDKPDYFKLTEIRDAIEFSGYGGFEWKQLKAIADDCLRQLGFERMINPMNKRNLWYFSSGWSYIYKRRGLPDMESVGVKKFLSGGGL